MLIVRDTYRDLYLDGCELLVEWLGPALRGLVARHFKERVCKFTLAQQNDERKYCKGCPQIVGCPYGETVEPDPPRNEDAPPGHDDAARAVVITPPYPADPFRPLAVRATFTGATAAGHAEAFWDAVASVGQHPERGLGPARLHFAVRPSRPDRVSVVDLPLTMAAQAGVVPRLMLVIDTPLNLEEREPGGDRKKAVLRPTFGHFFRAALRTLASLHRLYGNPLPDSGFGDLKFAAEAIPTQAEDFRSTDTRQRSNRSGQSVDVPGIVGAVLFDTVPLVLARWLYWGGRVHVGGHRVKGYGGWHLQWSLDPKATLESGPGRWNVWE